MIRNNLKLLCLILLLGLVAVAAVSCGDSDASATSGRSTTGLSWDQGLWNVHVWQ